MTSQRCFLIGMACGIASVEFGCQSTQSIDAVRSEGTANTVSTAASDVDAAAHFPDPASSTGVQHQAAQDASEPGESPSKKAVAPRSDGIIRCVAAEEDMAKFVWSLPEAQAQERYARARGMKNATKMIVEDMPYPGCKVASEHYPTECHWGVVVSGPLFRGRYYIHPTNKRVDQVDAQSYGDWCKKRREDMTLWWPKDIDCDDVLKHSNQLLSATDGKCQ